jgi:GxxExxY protein
MAKMIYPQLSYAVQGALMDVFRELRTLELSEEGWERALMIALQDRGIEARRQVEYALFYKGKRVGRFFIDIVVDEKIALELKRKDKLESIDQGQLLSYLKISDLKLGILTNVGGERLEFKRIPNFLSEREDRNGSGIVPQPTENLLYPELSEQIRAALYEVYIELGAGFMHMHYRRAAQVELRQRGIPFDLKKEFEIRYHDQVIETRNTRLLIIDHKVLLIVLAVQQITPTLRDRMEKYLPMLGLELGIIANFHSPGVEIVTARYPTDRLKHQI